MNKLSYKTKNNNRSYFFTLLSFFLIVSVVSTLLLTVFLTINFINSMQDTIHLSNEQLLAQTNYTIDQMDENAERIATSCMTNDNIAAYLDSSDIESTLPVLSGRDILRQLVLVPYVDSIYLYSISSGYVYSSKTGFQVPLSSFENQDIAAKIGDADFLKENAHNPVSNDKNEPTENSRILSYYFPSFSRGELKNVIVINMYASSLTDSIARMKHLTQDTDSSFILLDENRNYLTGVLNGTEKAQDTWIAFALEKLSDYETLKAGVVRIDGRYYYQVYTQDNVYNWYLLNYIPLSTVMQDVISSSLMGFILFFGVLCISIILCIYFSRKLNSPVETLAQALNENHAFVKTQDPNAPKEFQKILSAISSMQENNRQLQLLQKKTRYSQTQDCLNSLLTNHNLDEPALLSQKLERLKLSWLETGKLCMAVLKIDNYREFMTTQNPDDLWLTRFSVINIVEELASESFTCNASSRADDKFVLLLAIGSDEEEGHTEDKLMALFRSIQENIQKYMKFTFSIAYSTFFTGISSLPTVYANVENSLYLKMRYGHNCIIDPYQMDDMPNEVFQVPYKGLIQISDRLINNQPDAAWTAYMELTDQLFCYDYSEVMSATIHVIYSIYERLIEKYPMLKDCITQDMKRILVDLEHAEISDDILSLMRHYFGNICTAVDKLKTSPAQQNSAIVAEKIVQIIEKEYTDPTLCLCSIADQVGLSPNYTGHIFKQYKGKSVAAYILDIRMDKVAQYLQTTSWSLTKILDMVGLEKNNYFYTKFKNYFGMTLSEYKQKFQLDVSETASAK